MVKKEFITAVADKLENEITKKEIEQVMGAMSDVILETIAKEDSVRFGEVCTFSGFTRPARVSRNPSTGDTVNVPEKHGYPKAKFTKKAKEC